MTRTRVPRRPSRRRLGVVAVAAVVLGGFVAPGAAEAAGEYPGGPTPGTAVPIALNTSVPGSNIGASGGGSSSTAPGALPFWGSVVWYSVTTTVPGILTVTTSDRTYDTTLEVWTDAGAFVTQNDDYGGTLASQVVAGVSADTYLVGLGGWSFATGTATVHVAFAPQVPSVPLSPAVTPADGAAAVTWTAPAQPWDLTGYVLTCSENGGTPFACGSSAAPGATVTGLTNGAQYEIWVQAQNANGLSAAAGPVTVVPQVVSATTVAIAPAAPVSGEAFVVFASAVDVSDAAVLGTGTLTVTVDGASVADVDPGPGFVSAPMTHLAGLMTVDAQYSGTAAVAPSSAGLSLVVGTQTQALTIDALPATVVYGQVVPLHATSSHGLAATFSTVGACVVADGDDGPELHATGVGPCDVTATQAGTSEVSPATATAALVVVQAPQVVTVSPLGDWPYGSTQPVSATSDAGLAVDLAAAGACTLADGVLTPTGVGPCTVTATQAGDANHLAAEPVVVTVQVVRRADTVTLSDVPTSVRGVLRIPVTATSEHGLPVTIEGSGACTFVAGELVTIDVGTCTVTATTAGDELTEPATATYTVEVVGVPASVFVQLVGAVGDAADGLGVRASGTWLRPGTSLELTVHSTPVRVGSVTAGLDGTAVVGGVLPTLADGTHRLVATGTALDGTVVTDDILFGVEDGVVVWIGTPPRLAATGPGLDGALALAALWLTAGLALVTARRRLTRGRALRAA